MWKFLLGAYMHSKTWNPVICVGLYNIHSLSKLIVVSPLLLFTVVVIKVCLGINTEFQFQW